MSELVIHQIPALSDNYIYLAHDPATKATAVVDPSVAEPVLAALAEKGWRLTHILNTHHHNDHTGGNLELKAATGAIIVGPAADRDRIPGIDVALAEGEHYAVGEADAEVFDVPGHTRGHIAFWFKGSRTVFSGDTLFLMGCGRMFEGTAPQMWSSLSKLRALPPETRIYCGHEYTQANARFALSVEPENKALIERAKSVDATRAEGRSTIPGLMRDELATNPFLRADRPELQQAAGMAGADPVAVFAEIRHRKDVFK
jgi:hydroxyacylglutathione hydrolase